MPAIISPVSRTTLTETVAEQFIALIQEGHYRPGDRLPGEKELTEQLQVGRSTVREALKTLAAMGLIDRRPGHGTEVRQLDVRTLLRPELLALTLDKALTERLFEARKIIEPGIARLAAERSTEADLAAIRAVLDRSEAAIRSGQPLYLLSPEFHRLVAQASHNEVLLLFIDSIQCLLVERGLLMEQDAHYLEWELSSHRGVYERLAEHDAPGAGATMAQHIEESTAALLRVAP